MEVNPCAREDDVMLRQVYEHGIRIRNEGTSHWVCLALNLPSCPLRGHCLVTIFFVGFVTGKFVKKQKIADSHDVHLFLLSIPPF